MYQNYGISCIYVARIWLIAPIPFDRGFASRRAISFQCTGLARLVEVGRGRMVPDERLMSDVMPLQLRFVNYC